MRIELPSLAVRKVQCTIYCIYVLNAKENTLLLLLHHGKVNWGEIPYQ